MALGCLVLGTLAASAGHAHAESAAPGSAALRQARAAWDRGTLKTAEPLYREAIEKGGLAPDEVLEGYVRLGAIRAAQGKKDKAIAAFRAASILDARFAVPAEAGPRGPAYAARAKKDTAKIGSIRLAMVKPPKEVPSGKAFTVSATLDAAHVTVVAKIGLVAREGTSGKEASSTSPPGETTELEIPADLTMPSASLLVRVDALDKNGNRLASVEERVRVPDTSNAFAGIGAGGAGAGAGAIMGPRVAPPLTVSAMAPPAGDTSSHKGGFWSSPWPYIIGVVALAGAGTATYYGTRPSEQVSVGQVGVSTR